LFATTIGRKVSDVPQSKSKCYPELRAQKVGIATQDQVIFGSWTTALRVIGHPGMVENFSEGRQKQAGSLHSSFAFLTMLPPQVGGYLKPYQAIGAEGDQCCRLA
jgi:hypothetical protein